VRTTHPIRFHRTNLIPTLILLLSCMSEGHTCDKDESEGAAIADGDVHV
jgi:hypothetical protein